MAVTTFGCALSGCWRVRLRALLVLGVALCWLGWPSFAAAHAIGLSSGVYRGTADGVRAEITLARAELDAALPSLDRDGSGSIEAGELEGARAELESFFATTLEIKGGGARCVGALERAALTEQDGLSVELRYRCPLGARDVRDVRDTRDANVTLGFLSRLSFGHRHSARIVSGTTMRDGIFFRSQSEFVVPSLKLSAATAAREPEPSAPALLGFVRMGSEHILTGYDHVIFLLALLLTARRIRSLLWVVTAFTLGHSLSLALVVFGVIAPSAAWVEPAIALSVACVGIENLFRQRAGANGADRRWLLTFPFGLIHGLGFASALTEANVPRTELPAALFTFNLGVELGQLALLAVFLPLVFWLGRAEWFARRAVPALSIAVIVAGGVWFAARIGV